MYILFSAGNPATLTIPNANGFMRMTLHFTGKPSDIFTYPAPPDVTITTMDFHIERKYIIVGDSKNKNLIASYVLSGK